ncbi:MAG: DUF58 domain-containing protein [Planctomycetes bacterium]|nr:DUF58 domain-containing protein [Planctomycetota bacterium]
MPAYRYLPPYIADRLHGVSVSARRAMAGGLQGLHRSSRHGASVEFAEYRPYTPGDPPSLIDWSVYARTDKHLIRRFEEETNLTGYVLLDCSASLDWRGRGEHTKLAYACYLASGMMYALVHQGDRVGLAWFSSDIVQRHAPAGSAATLGPLLLALEGIAPGGRGDIAASLHQACAFLPRRSLVVVVSDLLQPPAQVVSGIAHLHHDGHDVRVLHVVDRAELALQESGLVEVTDLETGERLEVELDEMRDGYRAAVDGHLLDIRRGCLGSGADYRLVHTDTPIEDALR